jgi:hypothetical protein
LRIGLILNTDRVTKRQAAIFLEALVAATEGLDKSWFAAFAENEEEAAAEFALHQARKQRDAAMKGL